MQHTIYVVHLMVILIWRFSDYYITVKFNVCQQELYSQAIYNQYCPVHQTKCLSICIHVSKFNLPNLMFTKYTVYIQYVISQDTLSLTFIIILTSHLSEVGLTIIIATLSLHLANQASYYSLKAVQQHHTQQHKFYPQSNQKLFTGCSYIKYWQNYIHVTKFPSKNFMLYCICCGK